MKEVGNPASLQTPEGAMTSVRLCGAAVLAAGLLAGCQSNSRTAPYPKDPLLLSKKPMEAAPAASLREPVPPQLASAEPARPQLPATALVSATAPQPYIGFAPSQPTVVAKPVATIRAPVVAVPAVRSSGIYAHAPDHSWLQGPLDKHYQGHLSLRYCDAAVDDSWGGKVRLEADPRLAQFQDGDVIRVEGELLPRETGTAPEAWDHYPRYRIRSVELIQRKN